MFDTLFEDTINIIKSWKPKQSYKMEPQYRDDLMNGLREGLNQNPPLFVPQTRRSVRKESGKGYCDIAISEKVGIELKKDLKGKSEIDRLAGQILDYKKVYDDIIVVLVGETNRDALEEIKDKISDIQGEGGMFGLQREPRIQVIDKGLKSGGRG